MRLFLLAFILATLISIVPARAHHKKGHQDTDPWTRSFIGKIDCGKLDSGIVVTEFSLDQSVKEGNFSETRRLRQRLEGLYRLWNELCETA